MILYVVFKEQGNDLVEIEPFMPENITDLFPVLFRVNKKLLVGLNDVLVVSFGISADKI